MHDDESNMCTVKLCNGVCLRCPVVQTSHCSTLMTYAYVYFDAQRLNSGNKLSANT